jgi:hypothetical protein
MLSYIRQNIYCCLITIIAIILLRLHTIVTVFCYICRRRFSERILLLFDNSSKLMTVILLVLKALLIVLLKFQPDTVLVFGHRPSWQQFAVKRALIQTMMQFPN